MSKRRLGVLLPGPSIWPSGFLFVALAIPNTRPAVDIVGFKLIESRVEKKQLEMKARSAQVYKLENVMALNDLEARIWGQDRRPFTISGKLGVLDSLTQNFQIHSKSEVLSPDGYLFETENIVYNSKDRTLTTDDRVKAVPQKKNPHSFLQLTGLGLAINLNNDTYDILKDVVAFQQMSKTAFFNIKSNAATIFPSDGRANFINDVEVKSPTVNMVGEKLDIRFRRAGPDEPQTPESLELSGSKTAQRKIKAFLPGLEVTARGLLVRFDEKGEMVSSEAIGSAEGKTKDGVRLNAESLTSKTVNNQNVVLLQDHVEIVTGARIATCQEATFFMETGEILLNRTATVRQGSQNLQGERIRLSTKNSEISVEQANGSMEKREVFK